MPDPKEMSSSKSFMDEQKGMFNIVHAFAVWYSTCVTPFLRSRHGTRAVGGYAGAFLLMIGYAEYTRSFVMVYYYVPAWMLMSLYRRITADRNQDSYYRGYPWVFGWFTNQYIARLAETFVCFFAAVFVSPYSPQLADFLLGSIVALIVVLASEVSVLRKYKLDIEDAKKRARQMNDLSQGGNGW
jgi:hypothetical protein